MAPKSTKFKHITKIIGLLVIFLCVIFFAIPFRRSGDELFKVLVLDPIPNSIIVLHSQDHQTMFDGRLWLHFKISPDDFNSVLASNNWQIDPDATGDISNTISKVEDWWNPEWLGENTTKYSFLIRRDGNRKEIEYMWVNSQHNEVYLLYRNDFRH